jgi:hypothetical protein
VAFDERVKMGADEAGTLAAPKKFRETIFDPAVAAHTAAS